MPVHRQDGKVHIAAWMHEGAIPEGLNFAQIAQFEINRLEIENRELKGKLERMSGLVEHLTAATERLNAARAHVITVPAPALRRRRSFEEWWASKSRHAAT